MIRIFRPRLIVLSTLAVLGVATLAQQAGNRGLEQRFRKFDKNNDGKLTADEIPADYMARLDLDKNGEVTLDEARRALATTIDGKDDAAPIASRLFDNFDKNSDGKVTLEESGNAPWFSKIDRNGDGVITREEVVAVASQIKQFADRKGVAAPSHAAPAKPVALGPKVLKAGDGGVGRQVADVAFTDLAGISHKISEVEGAKGLVIAFTSATCPVSKRYAPSLARLEKDLQAKGIGMLAVNPMKSETVEAMKAQGFACLYAHDKDGSLTAALDARTTTEVFLLDPTRTLLYRGALDDQYGLAYNLDAPQSNYLADAINEVLAGRHPIIAATEAPGCELDRPAASNTVASGVTYHRDVARILAQNCVQCHHENGIAPFALDNVDEVKDRAKTIKRVVGEGTMPPWFAKDDKPNRWSNDHSLSLRDKTDLLAWLDSADRPLGDPAEAPKPVIYPAGGWTYGTPDAVFEFAKAEPIKAEGKMPYVNVTVDTGLSEDKWVQAIEVQPGNRQVVHHIIVSIIDPKHPKDRVSAHESFFAAYVPGNGGDMFPPGFARRLPAGAVLNFQMHYTPNGKATEDKTKIAFHWAKQAPKYEMRVASVPNVKLRIPPGEANHVETAERPAPFDMTIVGFMPHMHVRGKAFRYELLQTGGNEVLLDIPRYDFNWQLLYKLNEPLFVPRGTVMKVTAIFDNSAANKANPDPTKTVRWGQQTDEEMMIGYISYYVPVSGTATAAR